MQSLTRTFVVLTVGALSVVLPLAATSIQTDGHVEAGGFLFSDTGVITPGSIQAGGLVESAVRDEAGSSCSRRW